MIIDSFMFNNELDLLEIRLNELNDVVDYFILVEANKTQCQKSKPFYFENNKKMFEKFLNKIIHIKISEYPSFDNLWGMENFQRNCISHGLNEIKDIIKPNDYILISDLDEIPSKNTITEIRASNLTVGSIALDSFAYFFNFKSKQKWIGTVYCKIDKFNNFNAQHFRNIKDSLPIFSSKNCAGWHFCWMGGIKKIYEKLFSNIEPFDKNIIPPIDILKKQIEASIAKNSSFSFSDFNIPDTFEFKNIADQEYPEHIINNYEKYKNNFFNKNYDYIIQNNCPGLGDSLTFTPLVRTNKKIKIILPNTEQAKRISKIYDNLFDVEFKQNVSNSLPGDIHGIHVAKGRLIQLGFPDLDYTPIIKLSAEEIKKGYEIIKKYTNPIAIVINPSNKDPISLTHSSRSINRKVNREGFWEKIVETLKQNNYTPIQFGISSNFDKIKNIDNILLDLSIRDLAAVYYNIKKYVGVNTGDYHLMLAVGGKTTVFYPEFLEDGIPYPAWQWHYSVDLKDWPNQVVRVKYISKHIDIENINIESITFNE